MEYSKIRISLHLIIEEHRSVLAQAIISAVGSLPCHAGSRFCPPASTEGHAEHREHTPSQASMTQGRSCFPFILPHSKQLLRIGQEPEYMFVSLPFFFLISRKSESDHIERTEAPAPHQSQEWHRLSPTWSTGGGLGSRTPFSPSHVFTLPPGKRLHSDPCHLPTRRDAQRHPVTFHVKPSQTNGTAPLAYGH